MKSAATRVIVILLFCCVLPTAHAVVSFDWAMVGNPGNAADTEVMWTDGTTGYGSVNHSYQISKHEVTAGQYTEFLNAVAVRDPNGLYNTGMWSSAYGCKIARAGSSGNYAYTVANDRRNRPVNFVSFLDAMRFTNWLENGQPTGAQGPGTTEDGAYSIADGISEVRDPNARYFIPSENEWYKAAYYDPFSENYFDYAAGSNSIPSNDVLSPDPGNNANFSQNGDSIGSPYWLTEVGEFENSASPYGTFDQGGNVWEWDEALKNGSDRLVRGGALFTNSNSLRASFRLSYRPSAEYHDIGFRVASAVPEPAAMTLLFALATPGMLPRRLPRWSPLISQSPE